MEQRNLLLAIVLSVAILFGFQYYSSVMYPPLPPGEQTETAEGVAPAPTPGAAPGGTTAPAAPGGTTVDPTQRGRAEVVAESARVRIESTRLHGSISLSGGRIDDLTLANYRETLDPESPEIVVLSPKGAEDAYWAEVGWVNAAGATVALPGADTVWTADKAVLSPDTPVTLTWDNGEGLTFKRVFALDEDFLFTVTQRVRNTTAAAVNLYPYGLISRRGTPDITGFYILHEGLLGVFDGTLKEVDYDDLQETGTESQKTTGGWIGITDKYWLAALIPNQGSEVGTRFVHTRDGGTDRYQTDYLGGAVAVPAGGDAATESRIFVGAKEVHLLDRYMDEQNIVNLDLSIDFGWFYFLTKPLFLGLLFINEYVGNLGVAILLLTVGVKLVFFPLANKSYVAMSKMRKLQPEMTKLRERFGEDKQRLNQEMMALYKREGANPASGCLPMVIQIPVFFALYKVLFVTIEMRHAPFFGWIHDLSAPDPTSMWNLFGLIPWEPTTVIPAVINIGIWPIIMGATMFLQQKLNPQPTDPMQAKIFMFLPLMFTVMLAQFPAGLVIYWAWNNLLSIIQQKVIMHRMGVK